MNSYNNGFRPPFFLNGTHPPVNPGMIPAAFNRPPPPFPPPPMGFRPPGLNSFNAGPNNTHLRPNGFHRPNFNSSGYDNHFSTPPPSIRGPAPVPQRPFFAPDNVFSPSPNMAPAGQEGFPFSSNQQQPKQAPHCGRGRGRGDWRGRGRGSFANNRPVQGKKRKEKVDKRDLAENNVYFCDTCDRGFKTEDKYQEHVDGHIKCSYKDCRFIAAPKLVQLHITLQHRTGLAKKVWGMESEEDVRKWREERKRKFPTAANIAKKKEEEAQRIARGEVLHTKDFSAMRGGERGRGRGRGGRGQQRGRNNKGRGRGGRFNNSAQEENRVKDSENSDDSDDDAPPAEIAIRRPQLKDDDLVQEDSKENSAASKEQVTEGDDKLIKPVLEDSPPNTTSLGLLSSYGFSSSDDEDEEEARESDEKTLENGICLSDPVTASEQQFHPSPCKRPRLLPNPFISPNAQATTGSKQIETSEAELPQNPENTASDVPNVSIVQSQVSPVNEESVSQNPNKLIEAMDLQSESNVLTIPCKTEEHNNKSPNMDKNQSPSKAGLTTALSHTPAAELSNSGFVTPNDNLIEDVSKEKAKAGSSPRGDTVGETNKHTTRKKTTGKNGSRPLTYTLLEKLLAPDIRRERNKILQCVHYIVKNKFFDPVPTSSVSSNSTS